MALRLRCFWIEPGDQIEMTLRRFAWREKRGPCEKSETAGHDAAADIGRCAASEVTNVHGDNWPHADPRWPKLCACGYAFAEDDEWQFNPNALYRRADTGELMVLGKAPAGAMWDAPWLRGVKTFKQRPDGLVLMVRTPGGDWAVDGGSTNGNGWERTGSPIGAAPDVDVNPSIICGAYHGFLRHGWLEQC